MAKGFDTTDNCGPDAVALKSDGYDFVVRYLSQSSWKRITATEAHQLKVAGLDIILVYEDAPTGKDYFSHARGQVDALRAAQQATALNAGPTTTLYFAVDYDASDDDLTTAIIPYFQGVTSGLSSYASHGTLFRVGVYGSGATCTAITGAGLTTQGWLAQATGWRGHGAYKSWVISQGMPMTVLSMSVDSDYATGDYGAM